MRALRGILPFYHSTLNNKSYNFMGVPNTRLPIKPELLF
jgi:hypothetical protein